MWYLSKNRSDSFGRLGLKLLKNILFATVMVLILVGSLFWLNEKGFFQVDRIEIAVENMTDQPQYLQPLIKTLSSIGEKYRGQSLWSIDLPELNQQMSSFEWIDSIHISRIWPSRLSIFVKVKEVHLLISKKNGYLIPVVEQGQVLSPIEIGHAPDVALLFGEQFERKIDLRKKAVDFVKEVPSEGAFSKKIISEIHYDDKNGFWLQLIRDQMKVKMGFDQISMKSARVGQVMEYLESRKMDARVIDANLSKKVLVRLRKDP